MKNQIVQISGLKKNYTQGQTKIPVLGGLDVSVEKGETVAVVGKSGSGKSTFLSLAAGLDQPDEGSVEVAGHNLTTMSEAELTNFRGTHLGIIFQQFHLMPSLTALENIALPLEIQKQSQAAERAKAALDQVGLGHRADHLSYQLSGGENQRVAIARAFVHNPHLLLADEPSGNLDHETGETVMDILFDLVKTKEMTMILVTHSLELANRCSKVLTLTRGALKNHVLDEIHSP